MRTVCLQCRPCKPRQSNAPVRRGTLMKRRRVPFTTTFPCRVVLGVALGGLVLTCATLAAQSGGGGQSIPNPNPYTQAFTAFESAQVRPLAFTPNKQLLLATNTPDAKLEVYKVKQNGGLEHVVSVPVGLEPVAVAARTNQETWVVNHLSDSVSIVKLDGTKSSVTRTLLVGDEPRDIVFAGPNQSKAFITTAHRGQNSLVDPQLATPGVGRADVWVFDAASGGDSTSMGGTPLTILTFFADTPRALAVTPDGSKVYVAAFHSGNATASTFGATVPGLANPLPPLTPSSQLPFNVNVNAFGQEQPPPSVIVKYDGTNWLDENGGLRD